MPIQKWECQFCTEQFDNEQNCVNHEQTHAMKVPCVVCNVKADRQGHCRILELDETYKLTFMWSPIEGKTISKPMILFKKDVLITTPTENNEPNN